MRLLFVVHQYPPDYVGGTEFYTQQLAGALADRGHQVAVVFRRDGKSAGTTHWVEATGVNVYALTSRPVTANSRFLASFGDATLSQAFAQVVTQFRPDKIHVQHMMGWPSSLLRHLSIPYLVTLHDFWWICANAQLLTNYDQTNCAGPRLWLNCGRCALARAGIKHGLLLSPAVAPLLAMRAAQLQTVLVSAEQIIAPSQFVADFYRRHLPLLANLSILPHGISYPTQMPARAPRLPNHLRLTYIGSIAPAKGVHLLVEAFNRLPENYQLTLYGNLATFPNYAQEWQRKARPGVHFAGTLPREQLWTALAQTDLLIFPSIWYENFPLVIQESLAANVPIIASRLGALPEFVQDGVNGRLFEPSNAQDLQQVLQEVMEKPEQIDQWRAGITPPLTLTHHLHQLERLYQH